MIHLSARTAIFRSTSGRARKLRSLLRRTSANLNQTPVSEFP
jgi:hypothetical protein